MAIKLEDLDLAVETSPAQQRDELTGEADSHAARPATEEAMPNPASREYKLLYLPTMLSVFTARHQQMPASDQSLGEHVFGSNIHSGCAACREETEFLVAHQKKFF